MDTRTGSAEPEELSLKARALALLAKREHSRLELARKLARYTQDPDVLELLLDDLEQAGWLSDVRYAQAVIHRQASRQGAQRIAHMLRTQGVDTDHITELMAPLHDTEVARARAVWQKRFDQPPVDAKQYARQLRFMTYRGFSAEVLRQIIADAQKADY